MRREGRVHGSTVRLNKHEFPGYLAKAPSKPTNKSRVTARCINNRVRCPGCSSGFPIGKAICKCKTAFKARDLDVTMNHRLHEWNFSQKDRWGECYGAEDDEDEQEGFGSECVVEDDQFSRSPVIECPIELLVHMKKPKRVQAPAFMPEDLVVAITEGSVEEGDDDSWWEWSDGEEASHDEGAAGGDWVLVTEVV